MTFFLSSLIRFFFPFWQFRKVIKRLLALVFRVFWCLFFFVFSRDSTCRKNRVKRCPADASSLDMRCKSVKEERIKNWEKTLKIMLRNLRVMDLQANWPTATTSSRDAIMHLKRRKWERMPWKTGLPHKSRPLTVNLIIRQRKRKQPLVDKLFVWWLDALFTVKLVVCSFGRSFVR